MRLFPENMDKNTVIIGVDEAGRGPLAGPVTAAAILIPINFPEELAKQINDSKLLSEKKREALAPLILAHAKASIVNISPKIIDDINIRQATLRAMCEAVKSLNVDYDFVLVDGRDTLPDIKDSLAIIKGDQKYLPIAAASIIAKTTRDNIMISLDNQYPEYGFSKHKGYPTKQHLEALRKYGITPAHRLSYKPVQAILKTPP